MSLKSFSIGLFIACVFGRSLALYNMNDEELQTMCLELVQIDEEEVSQLNETRPMVTDNRNAKCYIRCILTGKNVMNIEGEFTPEFVSDDMDEKKFFRECKDVRGEDLCDKAFNFKNCIFEKAKAK